MNSFVLVVTCRSCAHLVGEHNMVIRCRVRQERLLSVCKWHPPTRSCDVFSLLVDFLPWEDALHQFVWGGILRISTQSTPSFADTRCLIFFWHPTILCCSLWNEGGLGLGVGTNFVWRPLSRVFTLKGPKFLLRQDRPLDLLGGFCQSNRMLRRSGQGKEN